MPCRLGAKVKSFLQVRPRSFFSLHTDALTADGNTPTTLAASGIDGTSTSKPQSVPVSVPVPTCIAVHRFSARNEDELTLETGDHVVLLATPPGGWWEGTVGTYLVRQCNTGIRRVSLVVLSISKAPVVRGFRMLVKLCTVRHLSRSAPLFVSIFIFLWCPL